MNLERNTDFPEAISGALTDAVVEEFSFDGDNVRTDAFLGLIAYFRDNINVAYIQQATLKELWSHLREQQQHMVKLDVLVGSLTYRMFTTLEAEYDGEALREVAHVYALASGNAYGLHGMDDTNVDRLKTPETIKNFLVGNPWFLFLMIADNHLSLLVKLHKQPSGA